MTRIPVHAFALASALAFFLAGVVRAEETTVAIDNFTFAPVTATVKSGTKVLFVNHDDIPHTVVLFNGKVRSKALDTDDSFTFVFDKPGEFVYFCGLHPQMTGKIIVTP